MRGTWRGSHGGGQPLLAAETAFYDQNAPDFLLFLVRRTVDKELTFEAPALAFRNPLTSLVRSVLMVHDPADRDGNTAERMDIAAKLFRERALSLGRAARFAGVPIAAFMKEVSGRQIPVITGNAESLRRDLEAIGACREDS